MGYLENRNLEIRDLHKIYCKVIPDFLKKYLEVPEIARLNKIGQNCGMDYVKIPYLRPKYFYSRLDHSLGVALIIWNFTKDKKQTLAGLFHDISTPVFAHVVDFLKGDHLKQEYTERETKNILSSSKQLTDYLKEDEIFLDQVCDYKIYPIADNKSPRLSSDRLECTFSLQLMYQDGIKLNEIEKIYDNLVVLKNELYEDELGFNNAEIAEKFINASLKNGRKMTSFADCYAMEFLANILRKMIKNNELKEEELYILDEEAMINRIKKSGSESVRKSWDYYTNFEDVKTSLTPINDKFCLKLNVKKRFSDPLVKTATGNIKISQIIKQVKGNIETFINSNWDRYVYSDYSFEDVG